MEVIMSSMNMISLKTNGNANEVIKFWSIFTPVFILIFNIIGQFAFPYYAWVTESRPSEVPEYLCVFSAIAALVTFMYGIIRKKWNKSFGIFFVTFLSLLIYQLRSPYIGEYQGDYVEVEKVVHERVYVGLADRWGKVVIPNSYLCICTVMNNAYNEEMVLGIRHLSSERVDAEDITCNSIELHLYHDNNLVNVEAIKTFHDYDEKYTDYSLEKYIIENYGRIIKTFDMWMIKDVVLYDAM